MAVMTITTTAANAARVVTAFGNKLGTVDGNGDPRDATAQEVKDAVIAHMKGVVRTFETAAVVTAAADGVVDIEPT